MNRVGAALLLIAVLMLSCRKNANSVCDDLREGILQNDASRVRSAIEASIAELPDPSYTEVNVQRLVQQLSGCGATVLLPCFDCIKTLPSQTEISVSVSSPSGTVTRMIDLSYSSSQKIVYHNMHN